MKFKVLYFTACLSMFSVACKQNAAQPKQDATQTAAVSIHFDNKTDPACGMEVTPEFTDSCYYKGKVYGFCSESCKETCLGDPEKYLTVK
jgi:YHS domain-containing protein